MKIDNKALNQTALKMDNINKRIEDIFKNIDTIMTNIYNSEKWQGETNTEYYNKYLKLKEYFPKINKGIETYSSFLKTTASNYENAENKLNSNIENNLDELNVN